MLYDEVSELVSVMMWWFRGEGVGSGEGEEAGDIGEHLEDDNGGASDAVNSAFEEGGDVGDAGDAVEGFERWACDEEVGDICREGEERVDAAEEGTVAESRRVEPASGSVHQQVQRGDEVAEAGVAEAVQGDDESRSSLTHNNTFCFASLTTAIIQFGVNEENDALNSFSKQMKTRV